MAGGIMSIQSFGVANLIINGNPLNEKCKTYFASTGYAKHTNFALQKFRVDYSGSRDIRLTEPSEFEFVIPKHADMLMDTFLSITLPDIWSPVYPPTEDTQYLWAPYDFKWIENIGAHLIRNVEITCGSFTLARFTGAYIAAIVNRDFTAAKKQAFDEMTGNVTNLHSPEYAFGRINTYPSAFKTDVTPLTGTEPSIRGRKLYIPLHPWYAVRSQAAFPLLCLGAGSELKIKITLRGIQDLFRVRDVFDYNNLFPHIRPDFNQTHFQMHRFLQTPPQSNVSVEFPYENTMNTWNADVHLMVTQAFLDREEQRAMKLSSQKYLVKDVFTYYQDNITGTTRVPLTSTGMVSSWIWCLQRNDAFMRNEWGNYTNWPYNRIPGNVAIAGSAADTSVESGPFLNPNGTNTGIYISGDLVAANRRNILQTAAIMLNGEYRELPAVAEVYQYLTPYTSSYGQSDLGYYYYNFCLSTDNSTGQPSGGTNMSAIKNIELELSVFAPEVDTLNSQFRITCDDNGNVLSTNQTNWRLYEYSYNATIFEERYNLVVFSGGSVGLALAR